MQVIDQNIHIPESLFNQLKITSILMIFCLFKNSTQYNLVYRDLFSDNSDSKNKNDIIQVWYACENQFNCGITYLQRCCDAYNAIFLTQSYEYQYLIHKTLELQPHYQLTLDFKLLRYQYGFQFPRLNNSNDRNFKVYLDGKIEHEKIYSNKSVSVDACLSDMQYLIFPISITIQHSSSSITAAMLAQNGYWGITEFQLQIYECSIGCDSCNSSGCFNQELFLQLFQLKEFLSISLEEGWQNTVATVNECLGFHYIVSSGSDLQKVIELVLHNAISFQLKLLVFNSQSTQIYIYIDGILVLTTNYVQKQLKVELCDDISMQEINLFQYQHQSSKLKIHIKVDLIQQVSNKPTYIGMRDFQLFLKSIDHICMDNNFVPFDGCFMNIYDCIQGCEICIKGICYGCLNGWQFLEESFSCIPLCGDAIITYNEECDDGNYLTNDGCHQCKYSCPNNCIKCEFGKCIVCQDEYKLDFYKKQCIPQCQDGITFSLEIGDNSNEIQFYDCQKCQQSCQIECLLCVDNKCYTCQEGWQLDDYQCKQICGDGLLAILSNEQCDDPQDSNCVDCIYQCDLNCLVCDKFQNCQFCVYPFEIKDNKCLPICGDNIITPLFEQCEDGNDIPYDGCFECQYQCSFGCIQCEKDNRCMQCDDQHYILDTQTLKCQLKLNIGSETEPLTDNNLLFAQCNENQAFINNKCVYLCGNGMLNSTFEQCDDGNYDGGDGCSALCYEEDSFKCINQENQLSICTFIQPPNFNLNLLSDKINQTKILELSFSQEVYISCDNSFEQVLEIQITPQSEFQFTLVPLINISSQLSNPNYQIYIQFLKPVSEPILQINIQKLCIFNEFDFGLGVNSKQIPLGTPFVISADMQKKVNNVLKMNDIMIYSTASISGFLLLTGNSIVFFNLLDLLQSLSYIKYMQYRFPPHLRQFLETYTKISLQPILERLHVDEIIAQLNGGTIPQLRKKSQQSKQIDALNLFYLMNAKGCFFSYIASLLVYLTCCLLCSIDMSQWLTRNYQQYKGRRTILRIILIFQQKIQFQCVNVKNNYFSLGVYQLFYSTLHQLVFSTLLQFPSYTFTSIFEIINSVFALFSFLFQFQIFIRLLSITTTQIQDKQKWKYFFQDSKEGFWALNFKPFQIFRTVSYITIIVEFIRYPEAQSILLSIQSLFYLLYLIQFRPIKSNLDLIKLLLREVLFLIITGSFLVYSFELNEDQLLLYGWLHIALFCFLIGFTLIIDILDQGQKAYYSYQKKLEKQKNDQIQLYFKNPLQLFIRNDESEPKINK